MKNNDVSKTQKNEQEQKKQVNENNVEKQEVKNGIFKSALIQKLVENLKSKKTEQLKTNEESNDENNQNKDNEIKDDNSISLYNIICNIENMSDKDILDICDDINNNNIKVGIDSKTIELLSELKENEKAKKLLQNLNIPMDVDVNSILHFNRTDFETVTNMGCKIGKVYVNSGWDEAAEIGYSAEKYKKIVTNAEKMLEKAIGNLPPNAPQRVKFMAIYNSVLASEHYDYSALRDDSKSKYTSRNLEGFFINGSSVCAGTALALKNLCECAGIEAEYVQGMAKSKNENRPSYHAWTKVKIDGKWFNTDPTWDANKVGKKYEFCLKSDADFYGHTEDFGYNPTYKRDEYSKTHRRTGQTRKYHDSTTTIDSETLEKLFYDERLDEKLNQAHQRLKETVISESYYKQATEQFIPDGMTYDSSLTETQKLTFKQKLAEFLNKTKHIKNISFVKKFINKNILKKDKTPVENNNTKYKTSNIKIKEQDGMSKYRVAPEISQQSKIANKARNIPNQSQNKQTSKDTMTR